MISGMKRGSVMVDVAIDQGGCFETSHATTHTAPVYFVDGVLHYCVSNRVQRGRRPDRQRGRGRGPRHQRHPAGRRPPRPGRPPPTRATGRTRPATASRCRKWTPQSWHRSGGSGGAGDLGDGLGQGREAAVELALGDDEGRAHGDGGGADRAGDDATTDQSPVTHHDGVGGAGEVDRPDPGGAAHLGDQAVVEQHARTRARPGPRWAGARAKRPSSRRMAMLVSPATRPRGDPSTCGRGAAGSRGRTRAPRAPCRPTMTPPMGSYPEVHPLGEGDQVGPDAEDPAPGPVPEAAEAGGSPRRGIRNAPCASHSGRGPRGSRARAGARRRPLDRLGDDRGDLSPCSANRAGHASRSCSGTTGAAEQRPRTRAWLAGRPWP